MQSSNNIASAGAKARAGENAPLHETQGEPPSALHLAQMVGNHGTRRDSAKTRSRKSIAAM
jgi:hypothetical protein